MNERTLKKTSCVPSSISIVVKAIKAISLPYMGAISHLPTALYSSHRIITPRSEMESIDSWNERVDPEQGFSIYGLFEELESE